MYKSMTGGRKAILRAAARIAVPVAIATMLAGVPARAQMSDGYKFLESVKKKEGEAVEQAIMDSSQIINSRDISTGQTALHIVTQRRDINWLTYLVAKGANVNQGDDRGTTPLQLAVNLAWREGVEFLVGNGARTNGSNDAGETPLITAVHSHNLPMVRILLEAGADPDRADNSGRSARDYARLDKDGTAILTAIQTTAKKNAAQAAKPVYGPSF